VRHGLPSHRYAVAQFAIMKEIRDGIREAYFIAGLEVAHRVTVKIALDGS
jgi:hypothetical protein